MEQNLRLKLAKMIKIFLRMPLTAFGKWQVSGPMLILVMIMINVCTITIPVSLIMGTSLEIRHINVKL